MRRRRSQNSTQSTKIVDSQKRTLAAKPRGSKFLKGAEEPIRPFSPVVVWKMGGRGLSQAITDLTTTLGG